MALLAAAVAAAASAEAPQLPLRFDADPPGRGEEWQLRLLIEPRAVGDLRIERRLYRGGERLRSEAIKVSPEPAAEERQGGPTTEVVPLPLRFEGMRDLAPGAYAQKIVAEGRRTDVPGSRPLHVERWTYFLVGAEGVRPLTLEEYSAIAERAEVGLDAQGREALVQPGGGRRADVPLSRTKGRAAVRLGEFGGLPQEKPREDGQARSRQEPDRSEADED